MAVHKTESVIFFAAILGCIFLVGKAWEYNHLAGILTIVALVLIIILIVKHGMK